MISIIRLSSYTRVLAVLIALVVCGGGYQAKAQTSEHWMEPGDGQGISWERSPEPDMKEYNVYRGDDAINFTVYDTVPHPTDSTKPRYEFSLKIPPAGLSYWMVSAIDFSGNESDPSNHIKLHNCVLGVLDMNGQPACKDSEAPGQIIIRFGKEPTP